jgi:16S rRNA (cytosine1402-N4)-methyltransferase
MVEHQPVLLRQVIKWLEPEKKKRLLDATLGLGGHTLAILRSSPGVQVLGIDQDEEALRLAEQRLAEYEGRFFLALSSYRDFDRILKEVGWDKVDGALLDLGVSSMQLDIPERGFSFLHDGPLDMRMSKKEGFIPARNIVNNYSFSQLKEIIARYGQDPLAGRIARAIVEARAKQKIETTLELAEIVKNAYPPRMRFKAKKHPATRTFQALRIVVNQELDVLEEFLNKIVHYLNPGARLVIISFHSLEDRIVKLFFKRESSECICPPQKVICDCNHKKTLHILTKKPVIPDQGEIELNSRSRSAKLRVAERVG